MMRATWKPLCAAVLLALFVPSGARCDEPAVTDAEFREFLDRWEASAAASERSQFRFRRFVYDHVFATEKRAVGAAYLEGTHSERWDLLPADVLEGEVSRRLDRQGKPFQLKQDISETWIWTRESVRWINPEEKRVDQWAVSRNTTGGKVVDASGWSLGKSIAAGMSLLPSAFLHPILHPDADQLAKRFELSVFREEDSRLWIRMTPRFQADAASYQSMEVIIDRDTNRPGAVKIVDPAGNTETVYTFSEWAVNEGVDWGAVRERNVDGPPLDPDVTGYRIHRVEPRKAAPDGPSGESAGVDPVILHVSQVIIEAHTSVLAYVIRLWWQTPASVQETVCELPALAARVPQWLAAARMPPRWRLLVWSGATAGELFARGSN